MQKLLPAASKGALQSAKCMNNPTKVLFWGFLLVRSFFVVQLVPKKERVLGWRQGNGNRLGWRQDNGNRSNQESKFDFLATRQRLVKIGERQQKIKIVPSNQQSNLWGSCQ